MVVYQNWKYLECFFGGTINLTSSGLPNVLLMSGNADDNKPKLAGCCSSCQCLAIRHLYDAASVWVILIASYLAGLAMKPSESASANPLAGLISFAICLASLS